MSNERRTHPRHFMRVDVLVSMPDADGTSTEFPVESINISLTGIQLDCNGDLVAALLRQTKLPFSCSVQFSLPGHEHRFKLGSQYLSYRRKSQRDFVMVVIFLHEDEQQKKLLGTLLSELV